MAFGGPLQSVVNGVNSAVTTLTRAPLLGSILGKALTEVSYVGRKSGKTFTLPVGYRRRGDVVRIPVAMPDRKQWWRNFLGAGAPLTIRLGDTVRTAHAVADRDGAGRVTVVATLDAV
ncbi:MAG: hypothetical protein WBB07_04250 [Mycobacterium sp.]